MTRATWILAAITAAVLCASGGAMAQATNMDLTGAWTLTVQSAAGTGTPSVTFQQTGEKLTGHYSSQLLGEADLTGTIKNRDLEFGFTVDVQGTKIQVKYTGTVESDGSLKGKMQAGDLGDGTFTGKRK